MLVILWLKKCEEKRERKKSAGLRPEVELWLVGTLEAGGEPWGLCWRSVAFKVFTFWHKCCDYSHLESHSDGLPTPSVCCPALELGDHTAGTCSSSGLDLLFGKGHVLTPLRSLNLRELILKFSSCELQPCWTLILLTASSCDPFC